MSSSHPNDRDGLLKSNLDGEKQSPFHHNAQFYFENRPDSDYNLSEKYDPDWNDMCLATFWSDFDIVYGWGKARAALKVETLEKIKTEIKIAEAKFWSTLYRVDPELMRELEETYANDKLQLFEHAKLSSKNIGDIPLIDAVDWLLDLEDRIKNS